MTPEENPLEHTHHDEPELVKPSYSEATLDQSPSATEPSSIIQESTPTPSLSSRFRKLIRSRKIQVLMLLFVILLISLIGYSVLAYTSKPTNQSDTLNSGSSDIQDTEDSSEIIPEPINDNAGDVTTPEVTPEQPKTDSSASTNKVTETPTYCGVKGMPEGACKAITSVEKDGAKDNSYVIADTSQLPDGMKIDIDEKSWLQAGPEIGNANFTAKYAGNNFTGAMYMQVVNGTWKVISFTINH